MTTEILFSLAKQQEFLSRQEDGLQESQSLKKSEISVEKPQKQMQALGPGHYNPKIEVTKPSKSGSNWARSKAVRGTGHVK